MEANDIAARLHFSPEFANKVADVMKPGTTVVVTDQQVVRKPTSDSAYFTAN